MGLVAAILAFVVTVLGAAGLIALHDRKLTLVEYGALVKRCAACGKPCFGVRRRDTLKAPWGAWRSECCGAELEPAR